MRVLLALCALTLPLCVVSQAEAEKPALPFSLGDCQIFLTAEHVMEYSGSADVPRQRVRYNNVNDDGFEIEWHNLDAPDAAPQAIKLTWEAWWEQCEKSIATSTMEAVTLTILGNEVSARKFTASDKRDDGTTSLRQRWFSSKYPGIALKYEDAVTETASGKLISSNKRELVSFDVQRVSLPWTAAELRLAYGRKPGFVHSVSYSNGDTFDEVTGISDATDAGFTIVIGQVRGEQKVAGKPATVSWADCNARLAKPKKGTTTADETITTDAGEFECTVYTYERNRMGGAQIEKIWLSKKHPGLIVKEFISVPGKGDPKESTRILKSWKQE